MTLSLAALKRKFLNIALWEWLALILAGFALGAILAQNAGGPIFSDELQYMELGLNNRVSPLVMNYYFHIFLQKPFLELAPTPLAGARIFWAFEITLTLLLIYISVRALHDENNIVHSFLAIILFLGIPYLSEFSGRTIIDFTAMLLVTLLFLIYILAAKTDFRSGWLLAAMGVLLFLTLKSKETSALAFYLLFGLGFRKDQPYSLKTLFGRLKPILYGFLAGLGLFILLNAILLKDAFFGIRPTDLIAYFNIVETSIAKIRPEDWFYAVIFKSLPLTFVLYLISGAKLGESDLPPAIKMLWIYPLLLLAFLVTILVISTGFGVVDRNFFPAIPLLCILAAQGIRFKFQETWQNYLVLAGYVLIGAAIMLGSRELVQNSLTQLGWSLPEFGLYVLSPLALIIMIIAHAMVPRFSMRTISIPVIGVILFMILPIYSNYASIMVSKPNVQRSKEIFYPFATFGDKIAFEKDMRFYVSPSVPSEYNMLGSDKYELFSIFNIYFKQPSSSRHFIFNGRINRKTGMIVYDDPTPDILKMNYDYALITAQDWSVIQADPIAVDELSAGYEISADPLSLIYFLDKKE